MLFRVFLAAILFALTGLTSATQSLAKERKALQPGQTFHDCASCPEMMVLPAGSFMMGSQGNGTAQEPVHRVTFSRPFAVGKFEVTFAEWYACVSDGGCAHKPKAKWGGGRQPVMNVTWDHITKQYLPWIKSKTGKDYRLLSEAEWKYAARGVTSSQEKHTEYSWGDYIDCSKANYGTRREDHCISVNPNRTTIVGSYRANKFGLHDMHGNVVEWTAECYHKNYVGAPKDGQVWATENCFGRVVRGGSWDANPWKLRAAYRFWNSLDFWYMGLGFRVARTLDP